MKKRKFNSKKTIKTLWYLLVFIASVYLLLHDTYYFTIGMFINKVAPTMTVFGCICTFLELNFAYTTGVYFYEKFR